MSKRRRPSNDDPSYVDPEYPEYYAAIGEPIMSTRKRAASGATPAAKKARRDAGLAKLARAIVQADPGYVRTGGYYGRFAGPGAELKFFDTANSFSVDATGEVPVSGQLCLIPQGVTESTRVGRKCTVKSITMRGWASFQPGGSALAATNIYVYVVLDKQCNGAAAAVTDVLSSNVMATAMPNLANEGRFVILKKMIMSLNSGAGVTTAYNSVVRAFEWTKRCNIPLEYSSTTGAITEIKSNNIFLLAGTDGFSSDDLVTFTATTRLRFSDQ